MLLDVTDAEQIRDAAERVDELNGLVNNAGIALGSPLELVPVDQLRHQLEVNLVGQVAVTQALLPALRRAKGRIVFMGSIAGRSALPFLAPYAASKHALEAVADSLRLELKPFGIPVSIVEPGSIRTAIWAPLGRARRRARRNDRTRELAELYAERVAAFRSVALKRGEGGAPADRVAEVVEEALTAERPHARYLVGRDAKLRAGFERLPDRLRDRIYERVLLKS